MVYPTKMGSREGKINTNLPLNLDNREFQFILGVNNYKVLFPCKLAFVPQRLTKMLCKRGSDTQQSYPQLNKRVYTQQPKLTSTSSGETFHALHKIDNDS